MRRFHTLRTASVATVAHEWEFYTGGTMDTATKDQALSTAADPNNPQDANNDTAWRCLNGPTGREATATPTPTGYAFANYCDLVGTWVDPDTGNWIGLVHNEFTPRPFGDGDQRLYVDMKSGYFYVYYGTRIVNKGGTGEGGDRRYEHVARAPISGKMATGTWQKWYDGQWLQPGVDGKESNIVSTDVFAAGYTPVDKEYDPKNPGTISQQTAAGTMQPKYDLDILNITYDSYLGEYIGTPESMGGNTAQRIYATKDLATQKWHYVGNTGAALTNNSWYRWIVTRSRTPRGQSSASRCQCFGACRVRSDRRPAVVHPGHRRLRAPPGQPLQRPRPRPRRERSAHRALPQLVRHARQPEGVDPVGAPGGGALTVRSTVIR